MQFVPMKAEHVLLMGELAAIHAGSVLTAELAVTMEEIGGTSAIDDNGQVVAVAGIMPKWEGSGLAWAWLAKGWRKHARVITEEVQRGLDATPLERVEAAVRVDFERGHAWAKRLGFELETLAARKWGADGATYSIYARVK